MAAIIERMKRQDSNAISTTARRSDGGSRLCQSEAAANSRGDIMLTEVRTVRVLCVVTALGSLIALYAPASANELLVSDRATNRILAFDPASGALLRVVSESPLLDEPTGITIGPGGFIYVSNSQTNVLKIDPQTGEATEFVGGLIGPGGIAYDPQTDSLFVSEIGQFDGSRVFQYDAAGALLQTIGAGSSMTGRTGIAIENGELYVSNFNVQGVGSVLKHDGAGGLVEFASGIGAGMTPILFGPNGLAFDSDGDLHVAGLFGQNIVKYPVTGGVAGAGAQLGMNVPYPSGLLVLEEDDAESLLISSLGNNNPSDPIYGSFLFPGAIFKYDVETGAATNFLVGDFDRDAAVEEADLAVWGTAFGTAASGDADGDGDSDGADFLAWQRSIGNQGVIGAFQPTGLALYSPPTPSAASVPEPVTGLSGAMILVVGVLAGRRRNAC
ncbi:MAG TPA: NHL repeat-containing protein [Lacipirellula sp.]